MNTTKNDVEGKLNKAISALAKQIRQKKYYETLKESITYSDFLSNKMFIIAVIRQGVPYSLFELIQDYTPFSERDWASFLDVSTKSLQRYRIDRNHTFKSSHSEKIIAIAEVTQIGMDVFGDIDKLRLWFETPNFALGNLQPSELLKDAYGKELVVNELVRINHGIFV
jgi:putative toxin-antitoxin system antitoxin component (TIGR02293 family)